MYLSIHKHISHQVNSKKSDITKTILKIEVLTPTTEESSEERTTLLISLTLYSKVFPPSFGLIFWFCFWTFFLNPQHTDFYLLDNSRMPVLQADYQ